MADVGTLARLFSGWTPTTSVLVVIGLVQVVALVKLWPLLWAKAIEARKIKLDADADLRGDLLDRIKDLEAAQHRDRLEFYQAMGAERKRCDEEMDAIRKRLTADGDEVRRRLTAAENENKGLMSAIRQNSQSSANLLGDPAKLGKSREPK